MLCQNCGKENSDNGNYCENCGHLIKKDNQEHKKRDRIISTISIIMVVFEIAYCIWYIFCGLKIVATTDYMVFNVLPIFIINIFILTFFMIEYKNIVATCSVIISIIIVIAIPIMYLLLIAGSAFFNCIGFCLTCGLERGRGVNFAGALLPFEFAIKIK